MVKNTFSEKSTGNVLAFSQASGHMTRQETDMRMKHYFAHAPGLFFTLRQESDGRISMPFLAGSIASLSSVVDVASLQALCHPEDAALLLAELHRSTREMTPCRLDLRVGGPAAGQVVLELKATPRPDESNPEIVEWTGFMHDVTADRRMEASLVAREQAESKRKEALEFSEGIINAIPDLLFEVDRDGRYLNVWTKNPDHLTTKDVLMGKTVYEVLTPENAAVAMQAVGEADEKGTSYGNVLEIAQWNGERRWYEHSLAKKHGRTPSEDTFIVLSRDVSERKRMEEALAAREREFRSLAENLPVPVCRYDRHCRRIYINPYVERLIRIPPELLLGMTPAEKQSMGSEKAGQIHESVQRVLDTGKKDAIEIKFDAADGGERWYQIINVPEFGPDGSVQGVLSIGHEETKLRQLEVELQRRAALEEQVSSLAQAAPGFLFLGRVESDGRAHFPFASDGVVELFGLRPEEIRDDAEVLRARYNPEDKLRLLERMEESARKLAPYRIEIRIHHPDKGERWIEIRSAPRRQADGATAWHGMMFDVTERKQAEHALAEARARMVGVLQTIPDMMWLKNPEGVYLECNHAFERLNGKPASEIVGKTDYDLFDPDMAAFFRDKDRAAIEAGSLCINEEWVTFPDNGQRVVLETRKVPMFDAHGKVTGVLGVARDISERKQIEATLAAREREFRTLVENSPDMVARHGPDFRYRYVNPACGTLAEGGTAALIGKTPSESVGGPTVIAYEQKLGEVFERGEELEFELQWTDKAEREFCILVNLTPEFDESGTVESVLAVGRDITELTAFRHKIHQMAFYDTLTALPNRALFNDRLRQMIADASWHSQLAAVMIIDMDRFKTVNDTLGHAVGDELLRETAVRLSACVRAYDTVARLGGDEFAILLPEIRSGDDLGRIASKILGKFDERFLLAGKEVFVSCSIGIALYPDDSVDADDLVKYADSAMYFAKRSGRNNFRFYSRELTASANEHLMLESELRRAVERRELELYYQPKVSLQDGRMIGSEALLRWRHPRLGMVPPNQFIQIAEDTGLIVDIGKWVLREACRTASEWNAEGKPPHKVAINLSVRQFQPLDLAMTVADILGETACRPEWIELEITESLLLDENGQILETLSAFRAMGISIAIDDFGTGYSALSYLARFPIDTLKIDRSFIHSVTTDNPRAELVKAILSIARCLGQEVVAEGVETAEQAAFLEANGCQVAQGFLYSRPLPKTEIASLPRYFKRGSLASTVGTSRSL